MSLTNNTLRCDDCAAELTTSGQWLRVKRALYHPHTGETHLVVQCERCVSRNAYQGTLEKLQRLGMAKGLTRDGQPAATVAPTARKTKPMRRAIIARVRERE